MIMSMTFFEARRSEVTWSPQRVVAWVLVTSFDHAWRPPTWWHTDSHLALAI